MDIEHIEPPLCEKFEVLVLTRTIEEKKEFYPDANTDTPMLFYNAGTAEVYRRCLPNPDEWYVSRLPVWCLHR